MEPMSQFPVVPITACALCNSNRPLRESHIIPRFVFDWLVESSGTGHMRFGPAMNLRVQDGVKQHLLCDECEVRLSVWENETARSLFKPYHRDTSTEITYGPWLAKFCASVCWRVLLIFRGLGIKNFSDTQLLLADEALCSWSNLMFERASHPGKFELHLLPVDLIVEAQGSELPPNMNRYLARAVEIDVVSNNTAAFVYAKMCKIILVGFVQMPNSREWEGTLVEMEQGTIKPGSRAAPGAFGNYLADRARNMAALQAKISTRQKEKIERTMRANVDRVANSESFAAISQDVMIFGDSAFDEPED